TAEKLGNDSTMTGGAYDFEGATTSLTRKLMSSPKKVTLVRHGLSSWNEESRVKGSSNLSVLTETGVKQAERCRMALSNISYDQCFSSPISRAKSTAEVIWEGRDEPLVFLDSLKEAHLFFLEGMKNGLHLELLLCNGENFLVVTHKSMLRGLICTVVLRITSYRYKFQPSLCFWWYRFRAIDINNGGISVFNFNKRGEATLQSLNMTAHMYSDHIYLF
ncbi:Histidine phosphatase superfamily, clade-1, partial [Dillenia turbinata]